MEASLEQHGPATNGAAIDWYRAILSNGKITEDKIKTEAGIFFLLKKNQRTKNDSKFAQDTPTVFQTYFCNLWSELEKYLKTAGNIEICFKSSVFYTKNKNSKQCFFTFPNNV